MTWTSLGPLFLNISDSRASAGLDMSAMKSMLSRQDLLCAVTLYAHSSQFTPKLLDCEVPGKIAVRFLRTGRFLAVSIRVSRFLLGFTPKVRADSGSLR